MKFIKTSRYFVGIPDKPVVSVDGFEIIAKENEWLKIRDRRGQVYFAQIEPGDEGNYFVLAGGIRCKRASIWDVLRTLFGPSGPFMLGQEYADERDTIDLRACMSPQ